MINYTYKNKITAGFIAFVFILFALMLPKYAHADISFDSSSTAGTFASGPSRTWSHTVTGSDTVLLVAPHVISGSVGDVVTGVTYNGVALTRLVYNNTNYTSYIYGILSPDLGTHDIVVSFSSSYQNRGLATSYTGVLQSGLPDAFNTGSATFSTQMTISLTTIADNSWTVISSNSNQGVNAGAGTTQRFISDQTFIGDSNGAITPEGLTSLQTLFGSSAIAGGVMVSFAPSLPVPTGLTALVSDAELGFLSTTGISPAEVTEWTGDNLILLLIGSGLALLSNMIYWIIAIIIVWIIISFSMTALKSKYQHKGQATPTNGTRKSKNGKPLAPTKSIK